MDWNLDRILNIVSIGLGTLGNLLGFGVNFAMGAKTKGEVIFAKTCFWISAISFLIPVGVWIKNLDRSNYGEVYSAIAVPFVIGILVLLATRWTDRRWALANQPFSAPVIVTPPTIVSPSKPNIKFVSIRHKKLVFNSNRERFVENPGGIDTVVANFRNEPIAGDRVAPLLNAKAFIRFFDERGEELLHVDSVYWEQSGSDHMTIQPGETKSVVLIVCEKSNFHVLSERREERHAFVDSYFETFLDQAGLPADAVKIEVSVVDSRGVLSAKCAFPTVDGYLAEFP